MDDNVPAGLWRVPTAIWLYGLLRAAAFALPLVLGTGTIGPVIVLVLPLWGLVVRGSARAWQALVVVDALSLAVLLAAVTQRSAPPLLLALTAAALGTLLVPSTRAWVGGDQAPA